jgi:plasmid stabilization system protein ParE
MNTVWLDDAVTELEDAALYYGDIDGELGKRFSAAATKALNEIEERPKMYRLFDGKARKARIMRFPYAIVYWLDENTIHIICVMHLHREPGYWHSRLS